MEFQSFFLWAFRFASGFPLYLFPLFVFSSLKKIPLSVVCCLLTVVTKLQKDAAPIPNALGTANSKVLSLTFMYGRGMPRPYKFKIRTR